MPIKLTPAGHKVLENDPWLSTWVEQQGRLDTDYLLVLLKPYVRPYYWIVDVGANIGDHTHTYAQWVPGGRVIAYEPQPEAFECLAWNTRNCPNVSLWRRLVGAAGGQATVTQDRRNQGASYVSVPGEQAPLLLPATEMVTLDAHLDDAPRLDLIKVDVEGYELEVLKGAAQLIRRFHPVLCLEAGLSQQQRYGHTQEELLQYVRGLGYTLLFAGGGPLQAQRPDKKDFDVVAVPEGV